MRAEEPKEKSTTPSSVIDEEEFKTGQEIKKVLSQIQPLINHP